MSGRTATFHAPAASQGMPATITAWLDRLVDWGLVITLFVAPLFMGGRYEIGRLVFVAAVCGTAFLWMLRQFFADRRCWREMGCEWLILAGFLLVLLQLIPISPAWRQWLSPEMSNILPLWSGNSMPVTGGWWNRLSFTPEATRAGMVMYVSYALLFLVVVQHLQDRQAIERQMRRIAMAAIGMAMLGWVQWLFSNGKFLWIYEHPIRSTKDAICGTFQNRNHFAHFLVLGTGPFFQLQLTNHQINGPVPKTKK